MRDALEVWWFGEDGDDDEEDEREDVRCRLNVEVDMEDSPVRGGGSGGRHASDWFG